MGGGDVEALVAPCFRRHAGKMQALQAGRFQRLRGNRAAKKNMTAAGTLPVEEVASRILVIRGEKVMIDADLA